MKKNMKPEAPCKDCSERELYCRRHCHKWHEYEALYADYLTNKVHSCKLSSDWYGHENTKFDRMKNGHFGDRYLINHRYDEKRGH